MLHAAADHGFDALEQQLAGAVLARVRVRVLGVDACGGESRREAPRRSAALHERPRRASNARRPPRTHRAGDYGTGYFGQSLEEPLKSRKLAMEIANGRLAMLGIMGLLAQDVVAFSRGLKPELRARPFGPHMEASSLHTHHTRTHIRKLHRTTSGTPLLLPGSTRGYDYHRSRCK